MHKKTCQKIYGKPGHVSLLVNFEDQKSTWFTKAFCVPWIPEPSTVNNKLKRREGSGSTERFFD